MRYSTKRVEKMKRKIRKMHWHEKMDLMDWCVMCYNAVKEAEEEEPSEEEIQQMVDDGYLIPLEEEE